MRHSCCLFGSMSSGESSSVGATTLPFEEFEKRYACLRSRARRRKAPAGRTSVKAANASGGSAYGNGKAPRRRTFVPKGLSTNPALSRAQRMLQRNKSAEEKTSTQIAVEKAKLEERCSVLVSSIRAAAKIAKLRGKFDLSIFRHVPSRATRRSNAKGMRISRWKGYAD